MVDNRGDLELCQISCSHVTCFLTFKSVDKIHTSFVFDLSLPSMEFIFV